jgi:hypothetical protein
VGLAAAAFVVVFLVPALKYAPNPPAVGDADTIGERTALYLTMIAISIAAAVAGWRLRRVLATRLDGDTASVLGVQLANRAPDEVRRAYWNGLRDADQDDVVKRFKDARWALLKNPDDHTTTQAATLRKLRRAGGGVWRAYTLKEALRAIFACDLSLADVTELIDRFCARAARSRLAPFVRLGHTIAKHTAGILAGIGTAINQARVEALNNKARLATRRAYGFHSPRAALALIHLTCGPITLTLPHEQIA